MRRVIYQEYVKQRDTIEGMLERFDGVPITKKPEQILADYRYLSKETGMEGYAVVDLMRIGKY